MNTRLIGVIGPGIVGMPMAALLAKAECDRGSGGGRVLVVQRASPTSGWKVGAINAGQSPIGGVEPDLAAIVAETVREGRLAASHDATDLADADAVLVCVQTDKRGNAPDYDPLFAALDSLAGSLVSRRTRRDPVLVVIESTLAPSSMTTLIRERFASHGLVEGRDVLLGNSPNRVMPGRLVERVRASDKLVAGLAPTTAGRIAALYRGIVTQGRLHETNSLTAEIVKTLENAFRDVRIAFAAELARWCDARDISYFALRDLVNAQLGQEDGASGDAGVVPSGGLLIPTVGVGGHCLPKDGILLWWRRLEAQDAGARRSLILASRRINDASPAYVLSRLESAFGGVAKRRVALLGVAYRADSEDTRNSPTLALGRLLHEAGADVVLHDPHVRATDDALGRSGLRNALTADLDGALHGAALAVLCVAHAEYRGLHEGSLNRSRTLEGVVDACNVTPRILTRSGKAPCIGIGRGQRSPDDALARRVREAFEVVVEGVAAEVSETVDFLNRRFAPTAADRADVGEVLRIARTCVTGCEIPDPVSRPRAQDFSDLGMTLPSVRAV